MPRHNSVDIYARNQYYVFNTFQGIAVFASAGASGLYWAYLLQQSNGDQTMLSFAWFVGMAIMVVLEGAKFLMQRDTEVTKKQFIPFVLFSIITGLATLMINAENIGAKKAQSSAVYQQAQNSSQTASDKKALTAWAKDLNITALQTQAEKYKQQPAMRGNGKPSGLTIGAVLSNPNRYKSYQHYQAGLDDIQSQINAKRAYDSAVISESEALGKMGENSGGAVSVEGISSTFDWFIQSVVRVTGLTGLESLLLVYFCATSLMEFAGSWFGRKAYFFGVRYREGKEALRKMIAISEYGYDPMDNVKIINDLSGRLVEAQHEKMELLGQTRQPVTVEQQPETLQNRTQRHAQEGSGKPEITAGIEAFAEKLDKISDKAKKRVKKALDEQAERLTRKQSKQAYSMAYFNGINTQIPHPATSFDMGKLGGFPSGFDASFKSVQSEPKRVQSEPKQVQESEPKRVQSEPKQVQGSKRKTETPDTGTKGENANRYRALKKAITSGEVQPTKRSIKSFKYGGRGMGDTTAKKYREALKKDGIIK